MPVQTWVQGTEHGVSMRVCTAAMQAVCLERDLTPDDIHLSVARHAMLSCLKCIVTKLAGLRGCTGLGWHTCSFLTLNACAQAMQGVFNRHDGTNGLLHGSAEAPEREEALAKVNQLRQQLKHLKTNDRVMVEE